MNRTSGPTMSAQPAPAKSPAQKAALCAAAAVTLAVGLGACTPVRDTHGYVADVGVGQVAPELKAGTDTKTTVMRRMGTPSTIGTFDQEAWYYITTTQERFAFLTPKTVAREVLAVRFDENDVVASVEKFGVEKGQVISYADERTPTRGRELGLIEQIFGNIGRAPTTMRDPEEGRRGRR
jgi:outer membrane protein assembly factor BamE (lipoprotein component of BamABCDE complex)